MAQDTSLRERLASLRASHFMYREEARVLGCGTVPLAVICHCLHRDHIEHLAEDGSVCSAGPCALAALAPLPGSNSTNECITPMACDWGGSSFLMIGGNWPYGRNSQASLVMWACRTWIIPM